MCRSNVGGCGYTKAVPGGARAYYGRFAVVNTTLSILFTFPLAYITVLPLLDEGSGPLYTSGIIIVITV